MPTSRHPCDTALQKAEAERDTSSQASVTRGQRIPPIWKWAAVGLGAFGLLCIGIVLLVPTPHGTVKVELSDPQAQGDVQNSLGMKFVLIRAGEFLMGSPDSDSEADGDERPEHRVRITRPYYLGVYEVMQAEYQQVMGVNPSLFKESGATAPVESVSWEDVQEFCQKLSALPAEKAAGRRYRLPTEAEWEYACRAGSATKYAFGDSESELGATAWYSSNSGSKTHPVGKKQPNAWGLYDMHGNVWEWCQDWYAGTYYGQFQSETAVDPLGPATASYRVLRGGSWSDGGRGCRSADRYGHGPGYRNLRHGFRVVLVRSDAS